MGGHWHDATAGTQNQGNHIGDRSCVRQSKLYRRYESGNAVKELLGTGHLKWNENKKEGAYKGQKVYDHTTADHGSAFWRPDKSGNVARSNMNHLAPASKAGPTPHSEYPQVGDFYKVAPPRAPPMVSSGEIQPGASIPYASNRNLAHPEQNHLYARDEGSAIQRVSYGREVQGIMRPHPEPFDVAPVGSNSNRRLDEQRRRRNAEEADNSHVFGNSTAASILKTRPW